MIKNLLFFLLGSTSVLAIFATFGHQFKGSGYAISVENCNYLYAGINNSINIVAEEDDSISLNQVTCDGATITGSQGRFEVHPSSPGEINISVKNNGKVGIRHFLVKPIIPTPLLGAQYPDGKTLPHGEFKKQGGVAAVINCCGFDAKCDMLSFNVTRVSKNGEVAKVVNHGARFEKDVDAIIQKAKAGDIYIFSKIFSLCPGDTKSYDEDEEPPFLHSLFFEIT